MKWRARDGDLESECGRFRIVDDLLSPGERKRGLTCTLLFNGRWIGDFNTKRDAKARALEIAG